MHKYCQSCGAKLEPGALTCAQCGRPTDAPAPPPQPPQPLPYPPPYQQGYPPPQQGYPQPYPPPPPPPYQQGYQPGYQPAPGTNTLALVGFILTVFPLVPFAGLALCIAGLSQCKRTGQQGRGLAVAGIVLNIVYVVLGIIGASLFSVFFAQTGPALLQEGGADFLYTLVR